MPAALPQTDMPIAPVLLSPVESYFWRFEEDLRAFRVALLFRLDGCIEACYLSVALRYLQQRHPKLQARIVEGSDGRLRYEFAEIAPPIPYEISDYDEAEFPWREETCRSLNADFPALGPLARVVVLRSVLRRSCYVILTVTHAFADGLSAINLMNDLLTEYAKAEAHAATPQVVALPVIAARRAQSRSGWREKMRLLRRFRRLKREEGNLSQTLLPVGRDISPMSQWAHWIFSREDTVRLVRRCRKEQASISGALIAAAFCGIMDCLEIPKALFKWQMPFNVRESLAGPAGPVTGEDLGCFVSNMNGSNRLTQRPAFWDVARRAHAEMQSFIQEGGPTFGYNMASFFYNLSTEVRRLFGLGPRRMSPSEDVRVTLLATNYGVLNTRHSYGSLRPRGCTPIFKNENVGPSLIMEALVLGQELNIGFAADGMEPKFWENLRVAVRRHLDAAAGAEGSPDRSSRGGERDQVEVAPQRMSVAPHE